MSDDLVSRLRQDAEMLQDGPQRNLTKLWHSEVVKDAAKDCQEAATALTEARAEIERLKASIDRVARIDNSLAKQLGKSIERNSAIASELATLRDILTLCGELGGMGKDETPADYLRRLIDEVAGVESLRARVREVVGPFADAAADLDDADRDATDIWEAPCAMQINVGHLRVARQLMEEVKR